MVYGLVVALARSQASRRLLLRRSSGQVKYKKRGTWFKRPETMLKWLRIKHLSGRLSSGRFGHKPGRIARKVDSCGGDDFGEMFIELSFGSNCG